MEIKKTEKASLKGNNMLYFLGGLNVVLILVWLLFNYKDTPKEFKPEEPQEVVETTEAVIINIPEPETPPPPPPPSDEPPPPPPPEIPQIIEETPEPVPPPPIKDQTPTPPNIPTGPVSTGPVKSIDLSSLKTKTVAAKEERVAEPVTVNRVKDMAVYPGCEKFKGNKRKLIACFGDELTQDILRYLDTEFPDVDKERVAVQLEFHVSTSGEITNVTPKRGDDVFKPEAKRALEKAADYLRRKGKKIEPATMADGSKATLIFQNNVILQNPEY